MVVDSSDKSMPGSGWTAPHGRPYNRLPAADRGTPHFMISVIEHHLVVIGSAPVRSGLVSSPAAGHFDTSVTDTRAVIFVGDPARGYPPLTRLRFLTPSDTAAF